MVDFGNLVRPLGHPVLYLRDETREAAPKCISGRTSYLQVRLAFHRYPQLIPAVFNRHGFGPPSGDYPDFNLSMGRSPGFGSAPADSNQLPDWLLALLGLGFPAAPAFWALTLPASATRRFILQKARHHPEVALQALTAWRRQVSGSISLPSRGAFHLSLTVLVHYRWPEVFSLRRWSSQIPPGFLVSRGTWELPPEPADFPLRGYHPLWQAFPDPSGNRLLCNSVAGLLPRCRLPLPRYRNASRLDTIAVWALPRSLAATWGIAVAFSSSGY